MREVERIPIVIIGGGQAGLSAGYYLAQREPSASLSSTAATRVGDSWRNRWDSLRLFTPARFDGLAGMPFPAAARLTSRPRTRWPTTWRRTPTRFALPGALRRARPATGSRAHEGRLPRGSTAGEHFEAADNVVIAMAALPAAPACPRSLADLDPGDPCSCTPSTTRIPSQLRAWPSCSLAGAGNSGSELAVELGRTHRVDHGRSRNRLRALRRAQAGSVATCWPGCCCASCSTACSL